MGAYFLKKDNHFSKINVLGMLFLYLLFLSDTSDFIINLL
jgi:hypothetical protein